MASFRKKYSLHIESPSKDAPTVASTPVTAASPPPAAEPQKSLEELAPQKASPSDEATNLAIKARLAEMERAETLQQRGAVQHYERSLAAEPPPPEPPVDPMEAAIADLPERAQRWYRSHPEFLTDPEKAAKIQYCHHVAAREVGGQFTDLYFDRMESLLGFRQQQQPKPSSNGHAAPAAPRNPPPAAPARNGAPARQQYTGPSVSAPPTREVPSFASGRPTSRRAPLSENELQIAKNSGISPEEYQLQKQKMERLKAAGAIQNG
jgi:hypothetical protein